MRRPGRSSARVLPIQHVLSTCTGRAAVPTLGTWSLLYAADAGNRWRFWLPAGLRPTRLRERTVCGSAHAGAEVPHNKQLQRTVIRPRGRAARAAFHCARAARWTAHHAAAELRRYTPSDTASRGMHG